MFPHPEHSPSPATGILYRQGDVLLKKMTHLPTGLQKHSGVTLALGEITGHAHRIQETDRAQLWKQGNQLFLEVKAPATLIHEEHSAIALTEGIYQVWRQREYRPEAYVEVED
ncbi:MAG: hypothetical protein GVY17_09525 [Cyanobacteria bacterium]|jgi:hypothetical protein|nr:hypothetical protein [Cyanobacteria bacterium GSL.Bin21]